MKTQARSIVRELVQGVVAQAMIGEDSDSEKTKKVNSALSHPDPHWGYHQILSAGDRDHMDKLLVKADHPLAYEPGTNKDRFLALHKAKHQF
jgi:hypothetical protein